MEAAAYELIIWWIINMIKVHMIQILNDAVTYIYVMSIYIKPKHAFYLKIYWENFKHSL